MKNTMSKCPLSVIIHTLNEEINIASAVSSVIDWVTEVIVVDSGSTDRTIEIAKSYNCVTHVRHCNRKGLVEQRNWALENINFKNEWVFILDADEYLDELLQNEITQIVQTNHSNYIAYSVRYKNIFFGKWLRYSSMYPTWTVRLFRHKEVRYENRSVNSHPNVAKEKQSILKGHIIHYDRRGFGNYLQKVIDFSYLESVAYVAIQNGKKDNQGLINGNLFGSIQARRRFWKNLFIRMPARPIVVFVYLYFIRLGFLDGFAGLNWAIYKSFLEWAISMRIAESKTKKIKV